MRRGSIFFCFFYFSFFFINWFHLVLPHPFHMSIFKYVPCHQIPIPFIQTQITRRRSLPLFTLPAYLIIQPTFQGWKRTAIHTSLKGVVLIELLFTKQNWPCLRLHSTAYSYCVLIVTIYWHTVTSVLFVFVSFGPYSVFLLHWVSSQS